MLFLLNTPQYSTSTHHNHDNLIKLTTSPSSTSYQHYDPLFPNDHCSVNQKKQMEGFARPHGMWNVGVDYIRPCHWSVNRMKVCDWWARSQCEQVHLLLQLSPTHKVSDGASSPWVPICSFKCNSLWLPSQTSVILGWNKIQLSVHSLRCSNTADLWSRGLRSQEPRCEQQLSSGDRGCRPGSNESPSRTLYNLEQHSRDRGLTYRRQSKSGSGLCLRP
jgi:hypothetical protein